PVAVARATNVAVADAPGARSPTTHDAPEQLPPLADTSASPDESGSAAVTAFATLRVLLFVTFTVKVTLAPSVVIGSLEVSVADRSAWHGACVVGSAGHASWVSSPNPSPSASGSRLASMSSRRPVNGPVKAFALPTVVSPETS